MDRRGKETRQAEAVREAPEEHLGLTIADTLARRLQQLVVELAPGFEPGRRLDVEGIAQRFGVSATPVKQALKRLEERGLVEIKPRRGHFVTRLSDLDVREIMATRSALEQAAIRICAEGRLDAGILARVGESVEDGREAARRGDVEAYRRADLAFHRLWVVASGNRRLLELYDFLLAQAQIVYVYVPSSPEDVAASLAEHEALFATAASGDLPRLQDEIRTHWKNSEDRALRRYQTYLAKGAGIDAGAEAELAAGSAP